MIDDNVPFSTAAICKVVIAEHRKLPDRNSVELLHIDSLSRGSGGLIVRAKILDHISNYLIQWTLHPYDKRNILSVTNEWNDK